MEEDRNCSQLLLSLEHAAQSPKDLKKYFCVHWCICFFQSLIEDAMSHNNKTSL